MRTIFGIDPDKKYELAIELLKRLQFQPVEAEAVQVVQEASYAYVGMDYYTVDTTLLADWIATRKKDAEELLSVVKEQLEAEPSPIPTDIVICQGSPAWELRKRYKETNADLIAIGSSGKSGLRAFFVGSTGRGLVDQLEQSILISKGKLNSAPDSPLKVVVATDHSRYAQRCLQQLLDWSPKGWGEVTIVSSYEAEYLDTMRLMLPQMPVDPREWVNETLQKSCNALGEKFAPFSKSVKTCIVEAPVNVAIDRVMEETGADLLVMGTRGHGFVDRMVLGSVSFHQAFASPHSVLLLHPD